MILLDWDLSLFRLINQRLPHPAAVDWFFGLFWAEKPWVWLIVGIAVWMIWKMKSLGLWISLILLVSVGVTDRLIAKTLKPSINRIRPCFSLPEVVTPMGLPGGQHSFPSNHSANTAAAAGVIYWRWRKVGWGLMGVSFLVGFSRIYHGAHFPLDVLVGWSIGFAIATLTWRLVWTFRPSLKPA